MPGKVIKLVLFRPAQDHFNKKAKIGAGGCVCVGREKERWVCVFGLLFCMYRPNSANHQSLVNDRKSTTPAYKITLAPHFCSL